MAVETNTLATMFRRLKPSFIEDRSQKERYLNGYAYLDSLSEQEKEVVTKLIGTVEEIACDLRGVDIAIITVGSTATSDEGTLSSSNDSDTNDIDLVILNSEETGTTKRLKVVCDITTKLHDHLERDELPFTLCTCKYLEHCDGPSFRIPGDSSRPIHLIVAGKSSLTLEEQIRFDRDYNRNFVLLYTTQDPTTL